MHDTFDNNYQLLKSQLDKLHNLTVETCEICGGTYVEHLDGATCYFTIDGKRFKMRITEV
jgi:hypothetical protein